MINEATFMVHGVRWATSHDGVIWRCLCGTPHWSTLTALIEHGITNHNWPEGLRGADGATRHFTAGDYGVTETANLADAKKKAILAGMAYCTGAGDFTAFQAAVDHVADIAASIKLTEVGSEGGGLMDHERRNDLLASIAGTRRAIAGVTAEATPANIERLAGAMESLAVVLVHVVDAIGPSKHAGSVQQEINRKIPVDGGGTIAENSPSGSTRWPTPGADPDPQDRR